jgi:ParB-like nuclease domain
MELHEVCSLFPDMTPDEFRELTTDISQRGQLDPIWTYEGQIIDGRHRYRACCILSRDPIFREWAGEGGSLLGFVVSRNLHRRQLTASQRAAIAAEIKPRIDEEVRQELRQKQREGGKKAGNGRPSAEKKVYDKNDKDQKPTKGRDSRAETAALMNVSSGYVSEAERIRKTAPDVFQDIKAGKTTISAAKRKLSPKDEPRKPSLFNSVIKLDDAVRVVYEKWPKEYLHTLADKLISLGEELRENGQLRWCRPDDDE